MGISDSGGAGLERLSADPSQMAYRFCRSGYARDFDQRLQGFLDTSTWHRTTLHHSMTMDFPTLLGYAESLSAIPRPGERGYEGMVAELRAVFERYLRDDVLETPIACQLFLGQLRMQA